MQTHAHKPIPMPPEAWTRLIDLINEVAAEDAEPDWAIGRVKNPEGGVSWHWYLALPMGSLSDDLPAFVAHQGTAKSLKAASTAVGEHIAEYDGHILGRDPRGPGLRAASGALGVLASGLVLGAAPGALGLPLGVVFYCTAGLVIAALSLEFRRRVRSFGYNLD